MASVRARAAGGGGYVHARTRGGRVERHQTHRRTRRHDRGQHRPAARCTQAGGVDTAPSTSGSHFTAYSSRRAAHSTATLGIDRGGSWPLKVTGLCFGAWIDFFTVDFRFGADLDLTGAAAAERTRTVLGLFDRSVSRSVIRNELCP